jgi:hypothetical protein
MRAEQTEEFMGSFEKAHYRKSRDFFTPKELDRLRELHQKLDGKFADIASLAGNEEEAETAIEDWEETVHERWELEDARPNETPLQTLLREHHNIWDQIMSIREEATVRNHPELEDK